LRDLKKITKLTKKGIIFDNAEECIKLLIQKITGKDEKIMTIEDNIKKKIADLDKRKKDLQSELIHSKIFNDQSKQKQFFETFYDKLTEFIIQISQTKASIHKLEEKSQNYYLNQEIKNYDEYDKFIKSTIELNLNMNPFSFSFEEDFIGFKYLLLQKEPSNNPSDPAYNMTKKLWTILGDKDKDPYYINRKNWLLCAEREEYMASHPYDSLHNVDTSLLPRYFNIWLNQSYYLKHKKLPSPHYYWLLDNTHEINEITYYLNKPIKLVHQTNIEHSGNRFQREFYITLEKGIEANNKMIKLVSDTLTTLYSPRICTFEIWIKDPSTLSFKVIPTPLPYDQ
jgi:hypothetical protein